MDIETPNNEEPQHLPIINGLMQGTVVYFKKCKANIDPAVRKTDDYRFGHYGFGVYFGEIPPGNIAPTRMSVFKTFGNLGLISFDDLTEFLGKEKTAEVIAATGLRSSWRMVGITSPTVASFNRRSRSRRKSDVDVLLA